MTTDESTEPEVAVKSPLSFWPLSAWRGRRRRWLFALLALPVLLFVAVVGHHTWSTWAHEREIWFDPAPASYGNWNPDDFDYQDVHFESADGTLLHGWFVPHPDPQAVVLMCHGSGGNLSYDAALMQRWKETLRVTLLGFDYRGYGKSEGEFGSEEAIYADSRAARTWLAQEMEIDENEIVMWGRSMGGAVAVELAAADGARGLILENAFTSLPDVAMTHYRLSPARWTMQYRFDSLSKIARYRGPLLQSHAEWDHVVPMALAKRLFAAANEPKTFFIAPDAQHDSPQPESYFHLVDKFLDRLATANEVDPRVNPGG